MTIRETRVMQAAIKWWESIQPCSYTKKKYLDDPAINTVDEKERRLALAIADYLKNKKG